MYSFEQAVGEGAAQIIAFRLHGLVPAQPIKWLRNIPATVDYSVHINPLISKRRAGSDDPPGGCGHSPPLLPAPCVIPMQPHQSAPHAHPAQDWMHRHTHRHVRHFPANRTTHGCVPACAAEHRRSEEHTSELQSLMRISYAVFCLKKKTNTKHT